MEEEDVLVVEARCRFEGSSALSSSTASALRLRLLIAAREADRPARGEGEGEKSFSSEAQQTLMHWPSYAAVLLFVLLLTSSLSTKMLPDSPSLELLHVPVADGSVTRAEREAIERSLREV
jgi:hypothetical protein